MAADSTMVALEVSVDAASVYDVTLEPSPGLDSDSPNPLTTEDFNKRIAAATAAAAEQQQQQRQQQQQSEQHEQEDADPANDGERDPTVPQQQQQQPAHERHNSISALGLKLRTFRRRPTSSLSIATDKHSEAAGSSEQQPQLAAAESSSTFATAYSSSSGNEAAAGAQPVLLHQSSLQRAGTEPRSVGSSRSAPALSKSLGHSVSFNSSSGSSNGTAGTVPVSVASGGGSSGGSNSGSSTAGFFARQRHSFANLVRLGGVRSSPGKASSQGDTVQLRTPSIARVTSHTVKGLRHADTENEDRVLCAGDIFSDSDVCSRRVGLFCVFDGHGGPGCSSAAAAMLPKHFKASSAWEDLKGALPGDAGAVERVLVRALEDAFARFAQEFEQQATVQQDSSGSCALVAAFCDGVVVAANAGDSKGLMYVKEGDKQSVRSTVRHNFANQDEVVRATACGGHFYQNRLMGCLLPTRAFGNLDVHRAAPGVLISQPQFQVVHCKPLAPGDAAALLLASDGLWDIVDTPQVVSALKSGLKKQNKQLLTVNIAEMLVTDAIRAGSDDDTSVIVLVFQ